MCQTCGCTITPGNRHLIDAEPTLFRARGMRGRSTTVEVLSNLLSANDREAVHNRDHLDRHGILAINLMSSPGSGKTSLLEAAIDAIGDRLRIAVIEGDLATENDAARIRAKGIPAVQITTGQACHLDAHMVHSALHQLDLSALDVLFIENVGNLVCPASFDLGHHLNVTLLSVTEGDDKPAKYPVMFRAADLVLLTKSDLLEVLGGDFDVAAATGHVRALSNDAPVLTVSSRRARGIAGFIDWLDMQVAARRSGTVQRPRIARDAIMAGHAAGATP